MVPVIAMITSIEDPSPMRLAPNKPRIKGSDNSTDQCGIPIFLPHSVHVAGKKDPRKAFLNPEIPGLPQ
jgi:hypothetical protein